MTAPATAHMETCEFCRGTGRSPRTHHRCPECYGAGEVEVWDEPAPSPMDEISAKAAEAREAMFKIPGGKP